MTALKGDAALDALRTRDPAQVRALVEAWTPAMLRLARLHVSSVAAAEDVVQESWLVALRGLERFEGRSSLRTYVLGIVVNIARRTGAAERRTVPFSSAWRNERADEHAAAVPPERFDVDGAWVSPPRSWAATPDAVLGVAELHDVIDEALARLPLRQRAVMTARDGLGLGPADVSRLFDISEGNQRVLLHRARAKVRAAAEDYLTDTTAPTPTRTGHAASRPRPPRPGHAIACRQLVELVDDYLDARLRPELRARVEAHLAQCEHCGEYAHQVRRVLDVTAVLNADAPTSLVDRLCDALRGDPRVRGESG